MTAPHEPQPYSFGAELMPDGTTHFRLWAPGCRGSPLLVIDGRDEQPMNAAGGGWYSVSGLAPAGTRYRFRVSSGLAVPDPASRLQSDGVHGWSVVVDPRRYRWRRNDWQGRPWHEAVFYEVHVGAYAGGYLGLSRDLPRLADLGITAVELMPVAAFSGRRNWGYDGVLPFAPHGEYGSPDELKELVDTAHGLGLMMFLDVVYNHFGPDGNYLNAYAPHFFAEDQATPWGAAINFAQPEVREYFIENAVYWLREFRFDGLRLDAAHVIDAAPGTGFLDELASRVRERVGDRRQVHLVLEHDDNAASHLGRGSFDAQWVDDTHHALHVLLTGQRDGYYVDYAEAPARRLARCLAEGFAYQGEPSPHRGHTPRGQRSAHLSPQCFVIFLQNHDQTGNRAFGERIAQLANPAAVRAATALVLLCPQIPLLFMGEEWGSTRPFLYFTDYEGQLADAVREGRRREFARFASFAGFNDRETIPDPNEEETFLRSAVDWRERKDAAGRATEAYCANLLRLRRVWLWSRLPGAVSLGADAIGDRAVQAAWRLADGTTLRVFCNLGPDEMRIAAVEPQACILFTTLEDDGTALLKGRVAGYSATWLTQRGDRG